MCARIGLVLSATLFLLTVSCGGSDAPDDTGAENDVITDAATDSAVNQDGVDSTDPRPDAIDEIPADVVLPDLAETDPGDTGGNTDTGDGDEPDTADSDSTDEDAPDTTDAADVGSDTAVPGCENAVMIAPGRELAVEGLPEGTASAWTTYSCDPDSAWEGPEKVFAFTAGCEGHLRLKVSIEEAPADEDWQPAYVNVLSSCSPDDCVEAILPSLQVGALLEIHDGETLFFAVEAAGTALPPFRIVVEEYCLDCLDNDEDGFDGFNGIYCPEGTDCNDDDAAIRPDAQETACDGVDQDCSGFDLCSGIVCVDNDEDGFYNFDANACPIGFDCNDSNPDIGPAASEVDCNGTDENCDGMDWCPGTGQQCDPCLLMTGCRDDHVCMPVIDDDNGFHAYCAKLCDDPLHCPAGSYCIPDVFEGHGVCSLNTTAECSDSGESITTACGDVIDSAACPGDCDPGFGICIEQCDEVSPLTVGTTVSGRLDGGSSTISSWPGVGDADGPESAWKFTAACHGIAHVSATEMADLELFVMVTEEHCDNTMFRASETGNSYVHELEFRVWDGHDYFVVLDSTLAGDSGPFTLRVDIDCSPTDRGPCEPCQLDLQCDSGFCNMPGTPPVATGACLANCGIDGTCPADSRCTALPEGFICLPSTTAQCDGQDLVLVDSCGLSYVSEACGEGWQCNAAAGACTNDCVDEDADGYFGYDAEDCPSGDDCDDADSDIHPGAADTRCNQIDEDCSGVDNCSDNGQCETCEGGHCAPGYYCFVDPNYEVSGICLKDCSGDMECPIAGNWDLSCWSWLSGQGDDSYYCRPQVEIACSGKTVTITDGCDRIVETAACDLNCWNDFGCVNNCTAAQAHPGCGKTVHGTTVGAADRTNYYYNATDTRDDMTGPEVAYTFTASCTGEFNAVLTNAANWLTLVIVKNSSGTCSSGAMVDYDTFVDTPDVVAFNAVQGEEYTLVVDGMDGASGEFDLTVNCLCGAGCVDSDTDGFIDHDATTCPSGRDCDGTDADIHPGAAEIECNDVDEDCTGYDACVSDSCTVDIDLGTLATPVSRNDSRVGESDEMTFYGGTCQSPYPRFNVETVYHFKPACSGNFTASVSDALDDQFDIYLLEGSCRADLCSRMAWYELTADVTADTDYFLVIDGNSPAAANTWKLDASIACAP